ncbi:hypothetical protein WR25_10179 [Diploscapter pachys]|uniref:Tudor domain-containing protein n=1 Tax=Diploscapter pachys TaxID=2018661 RepID=A0A2A2KM50_9BILA|nr:hypothetical protein WR25_10179 [Diploscapter pachys]
MLYMGTRPKERAVSPILDWGKDGNPVMLNNGPTDHGSRINRIPLVRTANVEILSVESPSRIWVRLSNHIADKLTVREPAVLAPLPEDEMTVYGYCLAPIEDRIYARCRILEIDDLGLVGESKKLTRVLFIDEGVIAWIHAEALGKMDTMMMFFPWQAILISICGPHIGPTFNDVFPKCPVIEWSRDECNMLRSVIGRFKRFKTRTVLSSVISNDYREPIKVDLYGFMDETTSNVSDGVSIGNYFAAECTKRIVLMDIRDGSKQGIYAAKKEEDMADTPNAMTVPPYRQSFPEDWDNGEAMIDIGNAYGTWTPDTAQVPIVEPEWLIENFADPSGEVAVSIEGAFSESPYEFYARPIKLTEKKSYLREAAGDVISENAEAQMDVELEKQAEAMIEGDSRLKEAADILDEFYSIEKNRSPMCTNELSSWLKNGKPVYAICACTEDRARYTGEWQRVQILSCKSNAEVRFLDTGGRELVLASSLYKIHPKHTSYPPLCVQLCMSGIADVNPDLAKRKQWSPNSKEVWKMLLREDVPLKIVGEITRPNKDKDFSLNYANAGFAATTHTLPIYTEYHVLCISSLKVDGEDVPLEEQFMKQNDMYRDGMAVSVPGTPFELPALNQP